MLQAVLLVVTGLVVGGLAAWSWADARWKAKVLGARLETEGATWTAEGTIRELRSQLQSQAEELKTLRAELGAERNGRVASETRLQEAQRNLDEQKRILEEAETNLTHAFNALSANALKSNNQAFLELAKSRFETIQTEAKDDLDTRKQAIEGVVSPLKESLEKYQAQVQAMEEKRQNAYGSLDVRIESLVKGTDILASALRGGPGLRGKWGQLTLRRCMELGGMSDYCDFSEQETVFTEAGHVIPDVIVKLPGGRQIAVDSKATLFRALEDAAGAPTQEEEKKCTERYAGLVRERMKELGGKEYWKYVGAELELVLMFLPTESHFAAAVKQDPTLLEDGIENHVFLVSPITLVALCRGLAFEWTQEKIKENAQEISDLAKEIYDRLRAFTQHFAGAGSALRRAVQDYNKAVASLESRVLISARKFKEMGAATGDELEEVSAIDEVPRAFSMPDENGNPPVPPATSRQAASDEVAENPKTLP